MRSLRRRHTPGAERPGYARGREALMRALRVVEASEAVEGPLQGRLSGKVAPPEGHAPELLDNIALQPRPTNPLNTASRSLLVNARDVKNVPGRKTDSTMLRGFSSSRRVPACLLSEKGQQRDGSVSNLTARPYIPRVYLYFAIVTAQFPWHPSCLYARSGQAHGSAGRVSTTPGATRGPQPYEAWR
jgi:hypothetical protein